MKQLIRFFNSDSLEIKNDGKAFIATKEFIKIRDQKWEELKKTTRKKKIKLWNGVIYRLSKITRQKDKNIIHLNSIDFKTHYAIAYTANIFKRYPFEKRPNGMYIGAYIETSDEKLIFGYRSQKCIARKDVNFIGGNLNKDEMEINCTNDLFNFFMKEFEEELGLDKRLIGTLNGLGIFISNNYRIAVILVCKLKVPQSIIMKNKKLNFEHKKLLFLTKEESLSMIDNPKINPNIKGSFQSYLDYKSNY